LAKLKLRESKGKGDGSSSESANGKKRGALGKGHGCNNDNGFASSSCDGGKGESGGGTAQKKDQCKRCGKFGH
jgi:hypothetical protein